MILIPARFSFRHSVGDQLMLISTKRVSADDEIFDDPDIVNKTVVSFHYHTDE